MIHGIGAETGTQVLLIAAVGGASSAGLGVPMLFAFVVGLLLSNFAIVLISSVGFVSSQSRERIYVVIGAVAGHLQPVRRDDLPVRARTAPCRTSGASCPSDPAHPPAGPAWVQSPPRISNRDSRQLASTKARRGRPRARRR